MTHVSRPLIGLLAATVLVFALWVVALKPSGSSNGANGSSNQGLGQYQSDINAAHKAVATAGAAGARAGADPAAAAPSSRPAATTPVTKTPAGHAAATTTAKPSAAAKSRVRPASGATSTVGRLSAVQHALHSHKVLALLFYNPAAPDDRAVHQELAGVPAHAGKVFKLAIPLGEIESYMAITDKVPVNFSPTLVLIAPNGQADEIVGYADPFEISQRVGDALAIRP
jgi:hypothetical protein